MQEFGPIIEPQPIEFSLDAPGWSFVLLGVMLLTLISVAVLAYRYYVNGYRRGAIKKIGEESSIARVNVILKSIALKSFARDEVSSLYGDKWIEFLTGQLKHFDLDKVEICEALNSSYDANESPDSIAVYKSFATLWIKKYHV
ncbi:MAG: DUF4381 domain-containing protein [Reichenbachiella sp.]